MLNVGVRTPAFTASFFGFAILQDDNQPIWVESPNDIIMFRYALAIPSESLSAAAPFSVPSDTGGGQYHTFSSTEPELSDYQRTIDPHYNRAIDYQLRAHFVPLAIQNPAGDPVNAPQEGVNEFSFSVASTGTFDLPAKAFPFVQTGTQTEIDEETTKWLEAVLRWEVDPIDDSHGAHYYTELRWSRSQGDVLVGAGIDPITEFIGLPRANTDFGKKEIFLAMDLGSGMTRMPGGGAVAEYEVFFPERQTKGGILAAANHPGLVDPEMKTWPNLMYYWTQLTGVVPRLRFSQYGEMGLLEKCPDAMGCYSHFDPFAANDDITWIENSASYMDCGSVYDLLDKNNNVVGSAQAPGGAAGIDCFGQVVFHEIRHRYGIWAGFVPSRGNDAIPDYDSADDFDGDFLSDDYEIWVVHLNPDDYSDGHVDAYNAEWDWPNETHNADDWSDAGKNHGP